MSKALQGSLWGKGDSYLQGRGYPRDRKVEALKRSQAILPRSGDQAN